MQLSEAEKALIVEEVLTAIKAESVQTSTLEKVENLEGINSLPAVRNDEDIVSVPIDLLKPDAPIEVHSEAQFEVMVAQGKVVPGQLYFIAEEG